MQPTPSLLGPRLPSHGSGGLGAPEPLSMSAVVYGAEAVRRGVDTLGVAAPPAACWWLTGADPLAAMMAEAQQLRAQVLRWGGVVWRQLTPGGGAQSRGPLGWLAAARQKQSCRGLSTRLNRSASNPAAPTHRQREALATPLDPVEHRALLEQCAAAMRPTWALDMGAFARVGL